MSFTETRPIGPVAAMYGSPGPIYKLPGLCGRRSHDPRSVHNTGPEWAFGIKSGKYTNDVSPGPKYEIGRFTRFGPDGTAKYSVFGRPRDLTSFKTPGPGTYSAERSTGGNLSRAPSFSFGVRHSERSSDKTPGPNTYTLPSMLGKTVQGGKKSSPSPVVSSRNKCGGFAEDLSRTPGPGTYKTIDPDRYLRALPKFTITSRNNMPGDNSQKPGPGAYQIDKGQAARGPTFGMRHSQFEAPLIVDPGDD